MANPSQPQAFTFTVTGGASQISQGINNYINGWIGIQPAQGVLQGLGTLIGNQMNASNGQSFAVHLAGEIDQYNMWARVQVFEQPKV